MLRSPRHAWHAHPRLNPNWTERKSSDAMVKGSIIHGLMLAKGGDYVSVDVDNWKTKEAQRIRAEIEAEGKIALLMATEKELMQCAGAALDQMRDHPDCGEFFNEGVSEAAICWQEDGAWFRIMVDRMTTGRTATWFDLKTTGGSADPNEWQRALIKTYAFQAAFYLRGARAIGLDPRAFRFVVVECNEPYGLSTVEAAPSLMALAEMDVERAISRWKHCLRMNHWPAYSTLTARVEAPAWKLSEAEEHAMHDDQMEEYAA